MDAYILLASHICRGNNYTADYLLNDSLDPDLHGVYAHMKSSIHLIKLETSIIRPLCLLSVMYCLVSVLLCPYKTYSFVSGNHQRNSIWLSALKPYEVSCTIRRLMLRFLHWIPTLLATVLHIYQVKKILGGRP